jgi:hypothetical protein
MKMSLNTNNMMPNALAITYGKGMAVAPTCTVAPVITGGTAYNAMKACSTGTWTGSDQANITFSYEWFVNGVSSAFGNTFMSGPGSVGMPVYCKVTASNGLTGTANSNTITVT